MNKPLPFDLPRLVMRRAIAVGAAALLLAAVLGLVRVGDNIDDEVDAAMALAGVMARLGSVQQTDDHSAIEALLGTLAGGGLRHLDLHILDDHGHVLLRPAPSPPDNAWLGWLYDGHRRLLSRPDSRRVTWQLTRPGGRVWRVSLSASHESERIEALNNLAGALALLLACIGGLLLVMAWNVRRAFAPLAGLLAAIERIEHHDPDGVRRLPAMPIRELEAIAAALRHLVQGLDAAETQRQLLSQKVLTLQEDERALLARELHDEFGQRLTALRFDAAWLVRRLADQPELCAVAQGMAERCGEVQRDIRELLVRLRPLGPAGDATSDISAGQPLPISRLIQQLQGLVQSWQDNQARGQASPVTHHLELAWQAEHGAVGPIDAQMAERFGLPRDVALAVYRLSQEALTNAARHAQAREVRLRLIVQAGRAPPWASAQLHWSVEDDGVGIADPAAALQQGNGLGGMQERVWALGGRWAWGPTDRPGLALRATLPFQPASLTPPPSA
jgi:two-component system sensor histidine kinase UhpB